MEHVFISYNNNDFDFAQSLKKFVEDAHFKTWIDSDQLHGGAVWQARIDENLWKAFALIVIMTPEAKASEYVTYEWAFAVGAKVPVIPVMYKKTDLHTRLGLLHALNFDTHPSNRPWTDLLVAITLNSPNTSEKSKEQWLAEVDQHIGGLRTRFEDALDRIEELETQLRAADERAKTGRNNFTELETQLRAALHRIVEMETQLREGQADQRNIEKAQIEIKQLQARLREVQDQTEDDQRNIKRLETQLQEAEEQAETRNKELALASVPILQPQKAFYMKLIAGHKTDVGKQREKNEDSVYRRIESSDEGDYGLFIVADGMGAHKAGQVASKLAVETISKTLDKFFQPLSDEQTMSQKTVALLETPTSKSIEDQLIMAIQQANKAILRHGQQITDDEGLGCTVTAALIQNDQAYIASVGDCRAYLYRDRDGLRKVTNDHSVVASLVEAGIIMPDDIYTHPKRNQVYRSLGEEPSVKVDTFTVQLQPGDTLLLCSDGLWEMIRDEYLLIELSKKTSPQQICDKLIELANANGGIDDISAVVVCVSGLENT